MNTNEKMLLKIIGSIFLNVFMILFFVNITIYIFIYFFNYKIIDLNFFFWLFNDDFFNININYNNDIYKDFIINNYKYIVSIIDKLQSIIITSLVFFSFLFLINKNNYVFYLLIYIILFSILFFYKNVITLLIIIYFLRVIVIFFKNYNIKYNLYFYNLNYTHNYSNFLLDYFFILFMGFLYINKSLFENSLNEKEILLISFFIFSIYLNIILILRKILSFNIKIYLKFKIKLIKLKQYFLNSFFEELLISELKVLQSILDKKTSRKEKLNLILKEMIHINNIKSDYQKIPIYSLNINIHEEYKESDFNLFINETTLVDNFYFNFKNINLRKDEEELYNLYLLAKKIISNNISFINFDQYNIDYTNKENVHLILQILGVVDLSKYILLKNYIEKKGFDFNNIINSIPINNENNFLIKNILLAEKLKSTDSVYYKIKILKENEIPVSNLNCYIFIDFLVNEKICFFIEFNKVFKSTPLSITIKEYIDILLENNNLEDLYLDKLKLLKDKIV